MRVQAPCSHCPHPVPARVPEPGLQAALESYGGQEGGFLGACLNPATPFSAACRHSRQAAEARLVEGWRAKVLWREGGVTWDVFLFNGKAGSVPARRQWRRPDRRPGVTSCLLLRVTSRMARNATKFWQRFVGGGV